MRRFSELLPLRRPISGLEDFIEVFAVPRETGELLACHADLLRHWQKAVNLVAPSTLDALWHRHMADSAQLVALVREALAEDGTAFPSGGGIRHWVDLGSGAGFPGLVAASILAGERGWRFHLIESHGRKCAFLREVARKCGVTVDIHNLRIENKGKITDNEDESVSVISARALAALPDLLQLSSSFVSPQTRCFFLKGRRVLQEIEQARQMFTFSSSLFSSVTEPEACLVQISDLQKTR